MAKRKDAPAAEESTHSTKKSKKATPPSTPPPRKQREVIDSSEDEILRGGPIAPIAPKPGRPAHAQRGVRSDAGPAASLHGLIPPEPSTPPKKHKRSKPEAEGPTNVYSPHTSRIVNFATQIPIHMQASPSRPRQNPHPTKKTKTKKRQDADSDDDNQSGSAPRLRLNHVKHLKENGWVNAGSCHTSKAYQRFEDWKNDYSPDKYFQPRSVKIIHASDPADRMKDIRARPFVLCWNTPDFRPPAGIPTDTPVPIFRILYDCLGHCMHGGADEEDSEDVEDDLSSSGSESRESDEQAVKKRKIIKSLDPNSDKIGDLNKLLDAHSIPKKKATPHKCRVKLHAEVYSDDLSRVHFFQRYDHPEADPQYLDMSPHIRQCIIEMASLYNLPASSIKRRLLRVFEEDRDHPTPVHRRPTTSQVDNAVNYNRSKGRLFTDPLLNIGVFAEHNPDKIFHYAPPNYNTDPPSQFATGIHHPYGTQCALLWGGRNGAGYDSTWANMNENRAPVTILITIDDRGCMVPCFAYLSANITTPTQAEFISKAKDLVEKMARDLLDGTVKIAEGLEKYQDELLAQAQFVVNSTEGWRPAFFMIDKARSSKAAIEHVFPGIIIRICQFHVMQAILRWERDHGQGGDHQPRPTLSLARKHQLLYAVRELQRCRRPHHWPAYKQVFRRRLEAIAEGSATTVAHLWAYFDANWFTDEWLMYWTDMGLPAGANRDGMLSTNNWTERAFKTFHQVFLGNRTNKSAYRLVLILANEWFQYYQAWKPTKRVNRKALQMAMTAHQLWSSTNAIQPFNLPDGRQAWRVARTANNG